MFAQFLETLYNFSAPHLLGLLENLFCYVIAASLSHPAPDNIPRCQILGLSLSNFLSRALIRSAQFLTTDSNVALTRYVALLAVALLEPLVGLSPTSPALLLILGAIIAGSSLFSVRHVLCDFWALVANSALLVAMVAASINLFYFRSVHRIAPMCLIREISKYHILFSGVMAMCFDVPGGRFQISPSLACVAGLGVTIGMSIVMRYCDMRNLFETSPVTFQVVALVRVNVMKGVTALAKDRVGIPRGEFSGKVACGAALSAIGFAAFLVVKARDESRIGLLPASLQPG
jgi:hypothetical protein